MESEFLHIPDPNISWEAQKDSILKSEKKAAWEGIPKVAGAMFMDQRAYDSPYLTLSDMKIPKTMREIFDFCRYFYKFDSLVGGAVNALARFPITDVIFDDIENTPKNWDPKKDTPVLEMYKQTFEDLHIQELLIQIGIDYHLYGNCFIFGEFDNVSQDPNKPDIRWSKVYRIDPSKITIELDPLTQEKTFKMEVPRATRKIIKDKKPKDKYDAIPDIIKQAVKDNKLVTLRSENVFHFSREGESGDGSVWGTPIVLNVLKQLAYRNILRQAQEAIAQEHIVPFRVYYLEETTKYDTGGNFNNVARSFADQLQKAAKDPNYKVVSPVPVNVLNLGGQGRALMLTAEIDQLQAEILAGMGVPREFIFGGVSYSAASISLRVLENQFITYRERVQDFLNEFLIKRMAMVRGEWQSPADNGNIVTAKLSDLKMQDDIQQKQLMINLNAANKVSDEYVYGMLGIDSDKMKLQVELEIFERMERERRMQQYQLQSDFLAQQQQIQQQAYLMQMQMQYGLVPPPEQQQAEQGGGASGSTTSQQSTGGDGKASKKQEKQASVVDIPTLQEAPAYRDQLEVVADLLSKFPEEERYAILEEVSPGVKQRLIEKIAASANPNTIGASASRNIELCNKREIDREHELLGRPGESEGILKNLSQQGNDYVTDNMTQPNPTILPPRRDTLL